MRPSKADTPGMLTANELQAPGRFALELLLK